MTTKNLMQFIGLIILVFVIIFGSKDVFEYSIARKYIKYYSIESSPDSICPSAIPNTKPLEEYRDTSLLIIDVLNSSINLTIVLISIFLAVFIFILGFLLNSMEKTIKANIEEIKNIEMKMQEKEKEIQMKLDEFEKAEKLYKERVTLISDVETKLQIQNRYIEKSSNYIYDSLDQEAEKNRNREMKNRLIVEKQILALYSMQDKDRIAGLHYFSENGTKEHMEDIRYVSENDLNEAVRHQAIRVLGRIEERENNLSASISDIDS